MIATATPAALAAVPQANSEVSALLGRIPSAVGYQPTLATDLGGLQERITTTNKGSITSVQVSSTNRWRNLFSPLWLPTVRPCGPCVHTCNSIKFAVVHAQQRWMW